MFCLSTYLKSFNSSRQCNHVTFMETAIFIDELKKVFFFIPVKTGYHIISSFNILKIIPR